MQVLNLNFIALFSARSSINLLVINRLESKVCKGFQPFLLVAEIQLLKRGD